jgi:putative hydrolase of the HAD superfamily
VKALMVDVDGVVVVRPADPARRSWAWNLETDLGLSLNQLQGHFFAVHWSDVVHGRADLHDRLALVLAEIAPGLSSQALADYWFEQDSILDQTLLDDLKALGTRGLELHLATVQEHHRARYLMENLGLGQVFQAIHYAADYGLSKPDPAFFRAVEARTGHEPESLLLIDDSLKNVESARVCGWQALHWDGSLRLAEALDVAGIEIAP